MAASSPEYKKERARTTCTYPLIMPTRLFPCPSRLSLLFYRTLLVVTRRKAPTGALVSPNPGPC